MEINDSYILVRDLMDYYELEDWTFKFNDAVNQFGLCTYGNKTITMSRKLIALNNVAEVRDTALHEIAHALAGPGTHHGKAWKAIAKSIGCSAERTHNAATPPAKFVGTCPFCGGTSYRNRRNDSACAKCCNTYNGGRYSGEFRLDWAVNPLALSMQSA